MAKLNIVGAVKKAPAFIKEHWNKPLKKGWSMGLKEICAYCVGSMGTSSAVMFPTFYALSAGLYIAAELALDVDHLFLMGIISSVITILRSPLISWLVDNVKSKMGKFRPWLLWLPLPCLALMILLAWIPEIFASSYWATIVIYLIVFNVLQFLMTIYTLSFNSMLQVISPSPDERTMLMSVGSIVYSLGPSIVNIILPFLANVLFSTNGVGGIGSNGLNQIKTFQWIMPIIAGVFFALGLLVAFGTKERMVLSKNKVLKVKFIDGIKKTAKNKYFWLYNLNITLGILRLQVTSFAFFVYIYMLRNSWAQSLFSSVLGFACVPGMALAPLLIKKLGKRNLLLISCFGLVLFNVMGGLLSLTSIPLEALGYILILMMFMATLSNSVTIVLYPAQLAQVYDYQQYKTGDRIEGFISQFGTILSTLIGFGTAYITPAVYKLFGYTSDTAVLYNRSTLLGIISTMCFIGAGSALLGAIPVFFWDFTEKKHEQIMEVLKVRAACEDGKCDDEQRLALETRILGGEGNVYNSVFADVSQSEVQSQTTNEIEDSIAAETATEAEGIDDEK